MIKKLENWQLRKVIFQKICIANDLLQNQNYFIPENHLASLTKKQQEDYLINDVQCESYRMLIVNYLIVLIGYNQDNKNDKLSFFKDGNSKMKKIIQNFHKNFQTEMKNLKTIRNKYYAHYENLYLTQDYCLTQKFFLQCLNLCSTLIAMEENLL